MSGYEVPIDGRCEYIDSIDSDMSLPTNTFLVKSLGRKRDCLLYTSPSPRD